MLTLILPLPPSINSYWGFSGHRRFLTKVANQFKEDVAHAVSQQSIRFGDQRLRLDIYFFYKDARKNDLSNRVKSLEDALVQAGLMDDDSQIDEFHVYRGNKVKLGKTIVNISVME